MLTPMTTPMPAPRHVADLTRHMRRAVTRYGHSCVELEWRIGHRQGSFRPGVGEEAWTRLKHALDASPAFEPTFKHSCERMGGATNIKCVDGTAWVHKRRLADVDVEERPWSVRASVSLEEPGDPTMATTVLQYERRKQRWSYRHRCWSIDLTRVRSNLPVHLDDYEDLFEVEIELVDPGMLFERPAAHLVEWGWRIAGEVCALMAPAK